MQTYFVQIITVQIESVVKVGLIKIVVHEELYCFKAINADLNLNLIMIVCYVYRFNLIVTMSSLSLRTHSQSSSSSFLQQQSKRSGGGGSGGDSKKKDSQYIIRLVGLAMREALNYYVSFCFLCVVLCMVVG